jgi:hypothetical protein
VIPRHAADLVDLDAERAGDSLKHLEARVYPSPSLESSTVSVNWFGRSGQHDRQTRSVAANAIPTNMLGQPGWDTHRQAAAIARYSPGRGNTRSLRLPGHLSSSTERSSPWTLRRDVRWALRTDESDSPGSLVREDQPACVPFVAVVGDCSHRALYGRAGCRRTGSRVSTETRGCVNRDRDLGTAWRAT